MKASIYLSFLVILNFSCTPKIRSAVTAKQEPLPDRAYVLVLKQQDPFENDGIEVGTIRSSDNGFSMNCSYFEVIEKLKGLARQNGANVIKITEHKVPDWRSTCDKVTVNMFRVSNLEKHEREIEWTTNRKLTWDDFKGSPMLDSNANLGAVSYCAIGFQTNRASVYTPLKIFVFNNFNCQLSWVRPDQKYRKDLLDHEQIHFDLCEIYTRQLRKRFAESNLTIANLNTRASTIFREIQAAYTERQYLYDSETNHGLDMLKQKDWARNIRTELWNLEAFAQ